jgi:hypothetical protein
MRPSETGCFALQSGKPNRATRADPMSESPTYVCNWRRLDDGRYEAWLAKQPGRRVEAETIRGVKDQLGDVIGELWGDGEPQFEFDPPLLEVVGWDHLFVHGHMSTFFNYGHRIENWKDAYTGGFCTQCGWPIGSRTAVPLQVFTKSWPEELDVFRAAHSHCGCVLVVSDRILGIFSAEERKFFETRPIQNPGGAAKHFFEILPKHFVPHATGNDLAPSGWHCPACDRNYIVHPKTLGYGTQAACDSDIGTPAPPIFFLGDPGRYSMCLSRARWEKLKAELHKFDLVSRLLAVIPEAERDSATGLKPHPGPNAPRPRRR